MTKPIQPLSIAEGQGAYIDIDHFNLTLTNTTQETIMGYASTTGCAPKPCNMPLMTFYNADSTLPNKPALEMVAFGKIIVGGSTYNEQVIPPLRHVFYDFLGQGGAQFEELFV